MPLSSRLLPIARRGLFSEDDFFSDWRGAYDGAVEEVLGRVGGRSLLADAFSSYRTAKEAQPQGGDGDIAASVSDTPESYVVVLDMADFLSGEISVRTRGLSAIVDAKNGERSFTRRYPLPEGSNTDKVVAAMSNEGILTINVPKTPGKPASHGAAQSPSSEGDLKLKVDIGLSENTSAEKVDNKEGSASSSMMDGDKVLNISRRGDFFKDSFFENVWNDFDSAMGDMVKRQKEREVKRESERAARDLARKKVIEDFWNEEDRQLKSLRSERLAKRRQASQEMMDQFNAFKVGMTQGLQVQHMTFQMSPGTDALSSYRQLRHWAGPSGDTQAAQVTATDTAYKVVIDVGACAEGDMDVKVDGETLRVTGRKGDTSFEREFSLPGLGAPEGVSAALSEDGVLTVTAPKA